MQLAITSSQGVVVGLVAIFAVGAVFVVAILLRPAFAQKWGFRKPKAEWGKCPNCNHATAPDALTCVHCGMQLRKAHRDGADL